jgi:glycosyltransferase
LNSDDALAGPGAIESIVASFSETGVDAVYGDLDLVDEHGRLVRKWRSGEFARWKYHLGWMTPHPATYVRRSLFEERGGFRDDLRISADYELMLRFFYVNRATVRHLPETLVRMTAGGASNGSLSGIARANWEVYRSWAFNGVRTSPTIMLTKPLSKVLQLRLKTGFGTV